MQPNTTLTIYLIAGEASGDMLGSGLMEALKQLAPVKLSLRGVGGPLMQKQGIFSLFPMQDIALMGFAEILPHIRRLKRRIRETVDHIEMIAPDVLITIDSPGFNFRVVQQLRKRGRVRPVYIHYVAPSVWAYKPERAKKVASLYDFLLCLLPFEPPYFKPVRLPAVFTGHPIADATPSLHFRQDELDAFRAAHALPADAKRICLLPGSRKGELKRMLPVFKETVDILRQRVLGLSVLIPVPADIEPLVRQMTAHWEAEPLILTAEHEKQLAFRVCDAALAKSGTIALELARAGTPMITAHRVHPASAWLLKRMIRTRYVNLINILKEQEAVPEYLQERCRPGLLADAMYNLMNNKEEMAKQRQAFEGALGLLRAPGDVRASEAAAAAVLDILKLTLGVDAESS